MDTNPNPDATSAPAPAVTRVQFTLTPAEIRDAFTVAAAFTDPEKTALALAKIDAGPERMTVTATDSYALSIVELHATSPAPFTTYANPTAIVDALAALAKIIGAPLMKSAGAANIEITPDAFTISRADYTATIPNTPAHWGPDVTQIIENANANNGPHPYEPTGYLPAQLARIAKHANPGRPVAFTTYNGPTKPTAIHWQTKAGAEVQTIQMPARIRN
jgi:hypothetical protein